MSKNEKISQPMDPSITEQKDGVMAKNNKRACYAIKTLVAEVEALFPETPSEVSDFDGRNTGLAVTFDVSVFDSEEEKTLVANLLSLTSSDVRVTDVLIEDDLIFVQMRPGPRTQDIRDSFGLADALLILAEQDDEGIFMEGSL